MASARSVPLPRSVATQSAHAASSSTSTRQLSVLLERSMTTLIGVTARKSAASRPALAEATRHEPVDESDAGEAFEHLGQEHGQPAEAQQLHARHLDPEGNRRLVERDESGGIEGVEEEVVWAVHHAPDAGAVVLRAVAVLPKPPEPKPEPQRHHAGETCPRR